MNIFRIFWVGLIAGLAFVILDALINVNPLAQRLYSAYRPIMRNSVNAPLGIAFDLFFGVAMAAIFVSLIPSLPVNGLARGVAFGIIAWFFRSAMAAASQFVMFQIPVAMSIYTLSTSLVEMTVIALIYAHLLRTP